MGYGYFTLDKSYYSVLYRYIGKDACIHYTKDKIEVYFYHEKITLHQRNRSKVSYNNNTEHHSSTHKIYSGRNPEFLKKKAAIHGAYVLSRMI